MPWVYILQSEKNNSYYIGSTIDINRRLLEHNSGKVTSTKRYLPFQLMLKQEYSSIEAAQKVERKLKSFKRRDFISKIVQDGFIKVVVE